jgi:hypothetical protein
MKAGSLDGFGFPVGPTKPTPVCMGFRLDLWPKTHAHRRGFVGSQIRPVCFFIWLIFLDFPSDEHGLLGSGSGNRRELGIWVGKCLGLGWDPCGDVDGGRSLGWDPYCDVASF